MCGWMMVIDTSSFFKCDLFSISLIAICIWIKFKQYSQTQCENKKKTMNNASGFAIESHFQFRYKSNYLFEKWRESRFDFIMFDVSSVWCLFMICFYVLLGVRSTKWQFYLNFQKDEMESNNFVSLWRCLNNIEICGANRPIFSPKSLFIISLICVIFCTVSNCLPANGGIPLLHRSFFSLQHVFFRSMCIFVLFQLIIPAKKWNFFEMKNTNMQLVWPQQFVMDGRASFIE